MNLIIHPSAKEFTSQDDLHGASIQAVATLLPYLNDSDQELLKRTFPSGVTYCRGAKLGKGEINLPYWEKIAPGDVAIFTRNKRMVGSGTVVLKIRNAALARTLDGFVDSTDSAPFELIYVVKDVRGWDIPATDVQTRLGYGVNDQIRFMVVKDQAAATGFIQWMEASSIPTENDIREMLSSPNFDSTDRESTVYTRREQAYLRWRLFKASPLGKCDICGSVFPLEYLVAAHIKPRYRCTHDERLDPHNLLAACLFGCDALFERGVVFVRDGKISADLGSITNSTLKGRVVGLLGRSCDRWNANSAKYFEDHRE